MAGSIVTLKATLWRENYGVKAMPVRRCGRRCLRRLSVESEGLRVDPPSLGQLRRDKSAIARQGAVWEGSGGAGAADGAREIFVKLSSSPLPLSSARWRRRGFFFNGCFPG
jgi:hypothetical protein